MKTFGFFDDINREFVINEPATPCPWINYLGNEDFFGLISNTAGGYDFYKDAKFRRITRYRYNDVPMDNSGRYFYINDNGTVWNPGWKPCKTPLDKYECRHGMNYTRITGVKNGIKASVLFFVPLNTWAEVQKLTIENTTDKVKTLKLFSYTEWCLWNAATDMENFQRNLSTGEVEIEGGTIYHKTEYKERRNHYAFYAVTNEKIDGYDTDREAFVGLYNELSQPQCVINGKSADSLAHGWSPIASHFMEMNLKPGESTTVSFVIGENVMTEEFKYWLCLFYFSNVNLETLCGNNLIYVDHVLGDANGDGILNVTDIVATVNYIMEKPSDDFNKKAADLNGDGDVNVTDIVKMVSIIMSGNN